MPGRTSEERRRLFDVAASNPEWVHVSCAAIVAANPSGRPVEVKHIRRRDVDLVKRLLHVRRSKSETSHRVIPLNAWAIEAVARMLERPARPHGAAALAPPRRVAPISVTIERRLVSSASIV